MEEIVTVDGKQFKLTTDRPLTATERAQTMAQIRAQTGCSSCGPRTLSAGGMQNLGACAAGAKGSGPADVPVSLVASPDGGVGPYTVRFYMKRNVESYFLMVTGAGIPAIGTVTGSNTQTVNEGSSTTAYTYKLIDSDVVAATGHALADIPTTSATGLIVDTATGGTAVLDPGKIRFATTTVDSCVGVGGPSFCIEYCDVAITCAPPTCNFVVT